MNITSKKLFSVCIYIFCGILCLFLTSCKSNTKNESEIGMDIPTEYRCITVDGVEHLLEINDLTVDRRRLEENDKLEMIYCTAQLSDGIYETSFQYVIEYLYYDEGGWILNDIGIQNLAEITVSLTEGPPNSIVDAYLSKRFSSYNYSEMSQEDNYNYYVTYNVTGIADSPYYTFLDNNTGNLIESNFSAEYEGTVTLHLELTQLDTNEFQWNTVPIAKQLWWDEGIPVEIATADAKRLFPSAEYQTSTLEEKNSVQTYVFAVDESNQYNTASGELVLEYALDYVNDDGIYFDDVGINIVKDRANVAIDWKIAGTWNGEFLYKSDNYTPITYTICPITFTIESITDGEIVLSEGYRGFDREYSLDDLKAHYDYPLKNLRVPYQIWEDGSLYFELTFKDGGFGEFEVTIKPNSCSCRFPWLNYSVTELTLQK